MEHSTAVVQSQDKPEINLDDLQLTATAPSEMMEAQLKLIDWCEEKIRILKWDAKELKEASEIAKRNKWRYKIHEKHHSIAMKRILFYKKIQAALREGYYIVPNFPVEIFAIRTDVKNPPAEYDNTTSYWARFGNHVQDTKGIGQGEGEYRNPNPKVDVEVICVDEVKNQKTYMNSADGWQDIDFPINMSKPIIMEATERAMVLKIFDRFGILPSPHRKKDPVIIGQIVFKEEGYKPNKEVSFMIAWHLNTNTL